MKKQDIATYGVYAVLLAIAITFGLLVLGKRPPDTTSLRGTAFVITIIGAILTGIVFNAIIFELAHIIGAKIGGYEITSINILYFNWVKRDGKWKFQFKSFDGLTGETKIAPKQNGKKPSNPTPFLTFGTVLYVIEALIFFTIFFLFTREGTGSLDPVKCDIGYFLLIVAFVGLLIFLYNIVPFKLDSTNDGYRLTLVSNPKNKVAFNELLRVQNEIEKGNKDVEIMTFDVITNFTADLNLNKIYVLLSNQKYEEALPLVNQIVENKNNISNHVYIDAISQLVFIKVMMLEHEQAIKEINELVNSDLKRQIAENNTMVSARAYILIEGLIDKSKSECIQTINTIQSSFKKTAKARRDLEIKLFNIALDKVIEKRPNWEFEQYRLKEKTDAKNLELADDDSDDNK